VKVESALPKTTSPSQFEASGFSAANTLLPAHHFPGCSNTEVNPNLLNQQRRREKVRVGRE
jgi:hypothetical protein